MLATGLGYTDLGLGIGIGIGIGIERASSGVVYGRYTRQREPGYLMVGVLP